jgi:hypothetical protein
MGTILATAAQTIAGGIFTFYILWIFYLAVMSLTHAQKTGRLTRASRTLGLPILLIGYAADVLVNATLFSLLVWDLPREYTVTQHINRLLRHGKPLQKTISHWVCHHLLDTFDPSGKHCRGGE